MSTQTKLKTKFSDLQDSELVDDKQHCCSIQTGSKETIYLSLESRIDLLQLERSWYRTNHLAVIRLKVTYFVFVAPVNPSPSEPRYVLPLQTV